MFANDEKGREIYRKLEALADTDEKKAGVQTFKTAMNSAVLGRRVILSTTGLTYRNNVDQTLVDRKNAVDAAIAVYEGALATAFDKARTDCASGVAPTSVRDALRTDGRVVFDAYKQQLRDIKDSTKTDIRALTDQLRVDVRVAVDTFKASSREARDELRKAFGG